MKLYLIAAGLVLSGSLAVAQETTPVVEVGANYSFLRYNSANGLREFTEMAARVIWSTTSTEWSD